MLKLYKVFFISLLLIIGVTSCNSDNAINPEFETEVVLDFTEATQILNVPYGNDSKQTYDIYLPANRNLNTKVIILVHGGGWIEGDKMDMDVIKNKTLLELPEYAIVNINYRLASQGVSPFPMQLNDITYIINDLKAKQNQYLISKEYALVGVSAGAHLSMLWSYNYDTDSSISMVGSIVGPTNFTDIAYESILNPTFLFFGITPSVEFSELYSPYHQVKISAPPTILFYGGIDDLIPSSQGIEMDAKLTRLSVVHEFTFYPQEGHGWEGENLIDTWTKLKTFVKMHH